MKTKGFKEKKLYSVVWGSILISVRKYARDSVWDSVRRSIGHPVIVLVYNTIKKDNVKRNILSKMNSAVQTLNENKTF
jgi:hypothetical protein